MPKSARRRPAGVSRRKKNQLGFEPLEDRRVMSAQSFYDSLDIQSYSSLTPDGLAHILEQELVRSGVSHKEAASFYYVTKSVPTDPLLGEQWHLINTGQQVGSPDFQTIFGVAGEDINVAPVWNQDIFGNGVVVAVIDSGVQTTHPDLISNIHPSLSLDALDSDANANPNLTFAINAHGTAVAGIVAATANNGKGGTGVAPGAKIVPIRLIDGGQTEQAFIDAFRYTIDNDIDITNNSWGSPVPRGLAPMTLGETLALRDSIFYGRDGKGVIHVFAAGNEGKDYDTSSYEAWVNSRYTIGVTGIDHDGAYNNIDGTVTGYPEVGANVLVAAPTGSNSLDIANDDGLGSGIWTTDTMGETGFNNSDNTGGFFGDRDFYEDIDYSSRFNGTSAATPMVSGVIALMLEANPNLTWRDVQEILVRSARQTKITDTLANGSDIARGVQYQNTWIVNQVPLFHDPDLYDPLIDSGLQMANPTLDPNLTVTGLGAHYVPTPQVLANGAGYTVSQGRGTDREAIGYAHGVVDAELAVLLAKQWHTKSQALSNELTWTTEVNVPFANNLPAAEVVQNIYGGNSVDMIIPGGLGGLAGFSAYWAEYLVDDPDFGQGFSARGMPLELTVPDTNEMTIETIEVTVNVGGDIAQFLNNVRMVLVSPSGTHSELNHYYVDGAFGADPDDTHQVGLTPTLTSNGLDAVSARPTDYFEPGSVDTGIQSFTFSTNRNWGERSDDAIMYDSTTGEPVIDLLLANGNIYNGVAGSAGNLLTSGWQLYFENYSTDSFTVASVEVAWHGNPIGSPNTKRISGFVGVDQDQNGNFNYSRVTPTMFDLDGDSTTNRLGEVVNIIDPTSEAMASNITVLARRASDNVVVDQFVTGADGNYYFDLVPGDYIIEVVDPLGRSAIDDSLSPAGVLPNYSSTWNITSNFFKAWDRDSNLRVPVDSSGVPLTFNGTVIPDHVRNINFLLDPGPPVAQQFEFSGTVIADLNSNGSFDGFDINVPQITVFADTNRNGTFDDGEDFVKTDSSGNFTLIVESTVANVVNVGVMAPVDWTFSNPDDGIHPLFAEPGDVLTGLNFYLTPPTGTGTGDNSNEAGYLIGSVYEDINANGTRQSNEMGIEGVQIFIDTNANGTRESFETLTTTTANGAFIFSNVPVGTHRVRMIPPAPFVPTTPGPGVPRVVNLNGAGTVSQIIFGLGISGGASSGFLDFGDLPADFGITLLSENGARHGRSAYYLGTRVVTEENGKPSADATGDDAANDEDGIVIDPLVAGSTGHLVATASRHGGVLQGWIDFNGDHVFQASEKVISNVDLAAGANNVSFQIPATLTTGDIFARFRYGEFGINSVTGPALIGEVEDYLVPVLTTSTDSTTIPGPDFNKDNKVDGRDFLAWQRGFGKTNATASQGDATGDKKVNGEDLQLWKDEYGSSGSSATVAAAVQAEEFGQDSTTAYEQGDSLDTSFNQLAPVIVSSFTAKSVSGDSEAVTTQEVQDGTTSIAIETQVRQQRGQWRSAARALPSSSSSVDAVFEAASFSASSSRSARSVATSGSQRVAYRFDREELDRQDAGEEAALQEAFGDYQLWSTL